MNTIDVGKYRTRMAEIKLRTVQQIGGWSNLTQLTRYTHPTTETLRRAVERIGKAK